MRTAHRIRSLKLAAVVLGAGGILSSSLPASAATLTVTSLACNVYHGGFTCTAYVSGGTGVYSYTWNQTAKFRTDGADGSYIAVSCTVGTSRRVSFFVTDSAGATASATTIVYCYAE
jgi:hypothetical protein